MKIIKFFILVILTLHPHLILAHGVGLYIDRQEARVILRLHHADDTPLAEAGYELSVAGAEVPYQSGKTDTLGRVVFSPGDTREWRLRVFSEDGHGIDTRFELTPGTVSHAHADHTDLDITKLVLGIGILLSGFAMMMLYAKRKRR
jgi:nickel transport protein